jgi:uncharacterized protein YcbK (DUF882 family)
MKRRFEGTIQRKWLGAFLAAIVAIMAFAAPASAETRSLKLYFIHTKERAEIVYKRNGRYDQAGLKQINRFLRDWRKNEPANMDPRLLDLVWEVYRSVGARDHIHVVSAYRSPATNAMLRNRSSGVAQKSQHMLGKAMDFYIPGVPLSKLRAAAFKVEGGGVGYYPKSGAPFVHLDVGNVRSWPRMSRNELIALFPDGKTLHLPADGKPLPGYNQALAAYQTRKKSGGTVHIASAQPRAEEVERSRRGGGFLAALFRGGADEDEDNSEAAVASAPAVAAAPVPVQAAPAARRQPAEAPAETIIAALPERNAPLPGVAPRPLIDVGAPTRAALVPGLPAPAASVAAPAGEAEFTLASVPLPTRRPDYAPELRVAAAELPATVDLPVAAIAAERARGGGSDAIAEMLAASGTEVRADVAISPPVPSLRPRLGGETVGATTEVASVAAPTTTDMAAPGQVFALAALPDTNLAPAARPEPVQVPVPARLREERGAVANGASPRVAVLGRPAGTDAATALQSGVRTTVKSSRPQAGQGRYDPKAVVVPVEQDVTRFAFMRDVTVSTAGGSTNPAMAHAMVRTAPQAVYTQGFSQAAPAPDAGRFAGKAVTFMPVAKFATN